MWSLVTHKITKDRAKEMMAECLRPLIAHPEDLSFIPKPTSGSSELPITPDSDTPTPLTSYGIHTHVQV